MFVRGPSFTRSHTPLPHTLCTAVSTFTYYYPSGLTGIKKRKDTPPKDTNYLLRNGKPAESELQETSSKTMRKTIKKRKDTPPKDANYLLANGKPAESELQETRSKIGKYIHIQVSHRRIIKHISRGYSGKPICLECRSSA